MNFYLVCNQVEIGWSLEPILIDIKKRIFAHFGLHVNLLLIVAGSISEQLDHSGRKKRKNYQAFVIKSFRIFHLFWKNSN